MTLQDLNHHFDLLEQQRRTQEMLEHLRSRGNFVEEIADMSAAVERADAAVKTSEGKIRVFVEDIEDNHTRLVFRLRFLCGLTWKEVAASIGGGNTDTGVRMVCYRYLERYFTRITARADN